MPQDKALVHGLRKGSEACAQALVQQALEEMAAAEDELAGAESDNAFRQMVAGLPADVREAVILRFAYRLKFKEIAVVQGVAARTAQARVRRGIQWLKANWREDM